MLKFLKDHHNDNVNAIAIPRVFSENRRAKNLCSHWACLKNNIPAKSKQNGSRIHLNINDTILAHYHTMPYFDALKIYSCGKHHE